MRNVLNQTLREKWNVPANDKPKWTSFETAENDLLELEEMGSVKVETIANWRAFFEERKRDLEMDQLL